MPQLSSICSAARNAPSTNILCWSLACQTVGSLPSANSFAFSSACHASSILSVFCCSFSNSAKTNMCASSSQLLKSFGLPSTNSRAMLKAWFVLPCLANSPAKLDAEAAASAPCMPCRTSWACSSLFWDINSETSANTVLGCWSPSRIAFR